MTNQTLAPIKNKRPFVLSRSTFAGSGRYAAHSLGENYRTWDALRYSIAGVMNFNIVGIPMTGPDTCGYFGKEVEDELCGRWIQLATFFPFARQNNDGSQGPSFNEPYKLKEPYQTWARNALYDRLQYSRHMYTCLFQASVTGQSCFDPLMFHWPEDRETFKDPEHSFMVGESLKVTPVL